MDHPTPVDSLAVASEASRVALRMAVGMMAIFMLLTCADAVTTNVGLSNPDARELNAHLLDHSGRLGLGFWGVHLFIALVLALSVRRGVAGMAALLPHLEQRSAADVFSFRSDEGLNSWRHLFMTTYALLQFLIGPLSNLAEFAWGLGIPGILGRVGTMVLGETADVQSYLHYPVIYTGSILAFFLASPVTRAIVRRIARAHPAIFKPVEAR